jgi:uncharacterized glyoxalase superfamily protein PhnB
MTAHPAQIQFRSVAPVFLVSDVNKTAAWYAEHLGFETLGLFPAQGDASWASMQRGGAEIMLQRLAGYRKPDEYSRRDGGVWDGYIRLSGVKQLYDSIKDPSIVNMSLRQQPYGDWEFEVRDLNGYVLVFGGDEHLPA